jgi:hypothetical protein
MTLPTTSLSFSALQTEFGGSNPISLSEYYRGAGGGYVPVGTTSSYGTIPTSGEISMGVFRGTTKVTGATLTVGSASNTFGGGKGTPYYSLFLYGFAPEGVIANGTHYEDFEGYFQLAYNPFGSVSGNIYDASNNPRTLLEASWLTFTCETPIAEYRMRIVVAGDMSGYYTPWLNGVQIASQQFGVYNGSTTTFQWLKGTLNDGSQIPGSDSWPNNSTPESNPFGSNGSTPVLQLL